MYKIVRDGKLWGVVDSNDNLVNQEPMSKQDARNLADACNTPASSHRADEHPEMDK